MGTSLVTLHGFTQNRRCWGAFGRALDDATACRHVDVPGHGGEPITRDDDLWRVADRFADRHGPASWLGYSLGGRLALHVAIARPDAVGRLVLIGTNPGIDDPAERERRRRHDEDLARRLDSEGLDAFLDDWLAQPLFSRLDREASCREERSANDAAQLATSLRVMGTGSQDPLWRHLPALEMPVLAISGADDTKFGELAARMVAAWGGPARHVRIDNAGHACHLERPAAVADVILSWLDAPITPVSPVSAVSPVSPVSPVSAVTPVSPSGDPGATSNPTG